MEIKINLEQRLYVIPFTGGITYFGFDNCYRDAVAMAEKMNALKSVSKGLEYIAPTPEMIGTIDCYEAYQHLLGHFSKHQASKQTWYTPGTPAKVRSILKMHTTKWASFGCFLAIRKQDVTPVKNTMSSASLGAPAER